MLQVVSAVVFYAMFAGLLLLLYWIGRTVKIYATAWLTLAQVQKQHADSMQKLADSVYLLAQSLQRPPV